MAHTPGTSEQNWNLPNLITFARLGLALVLFGMMSVGVGWLWSAGLFVVAVLTDVLDGWIARKYQLITQLGRIMDPFVDKFITSGVFLFLLPYPQSGVNPWMVVIVLGREMLVTSLRGLLEQRGADFSAAVSGKVKMFLQCASATVALALMDDSLRSQMGQVGLLVRDGFLWGMTGFTAWSGYEYVVRGTALLRATTQRN